jgi:hypothetical protein
MDLDLCRSFNHGNGRFRGCHIPWIDVFELKGLGGLHMPIDTDSNGDIPSDRCRDGDLQAGANDGCFRNYSANVGRVFNITVELGDFKKERTSAFGGTTIGV